ncbi:MAG: hypothetical protein HKN07_06115 [Acidimicrobiia bacterium]|nr:hypothetical protein [Acidimicrobiia bacterium]
MKTLSVRRRFTVVLVVGMLTMAVVASPAGAAGAKQTGEGGNFDTTWTEYDPDDILGLPGNVHIGYLFGWSDQWGSYMYGNVTDFDCDEGEIPGYGHDIAEAIVVTGERAAEAAVEDTIREVIDSGGSRIDKRAVVRAVGDSINKEVSDAVVEVFEEEFPLCDYVQDRFLDGTGTATFTVDTAAGETRVSGTLTVYGGHGGHGEPGDVLGTPPVNLTISGGDWEKYENAYMYWGADYRYAYSSEGTTLFGGTVSGAIGGMGFDDDEDDTSWGVFGSFSYKAYERVR